ncbi:MAG: triose-phosphate isomerase [Actinomycetota bacterium]|nr:triose-phosphate isomerase [Acidimicrobiaceae bacterium]MEC7899687.1 triose-phosphate isomerase [Actinomycetota bacterium]
MRKPLISANWKMNHNHFEAIQTIQRLSYALSSSDYENVDVSVHPPFTDLRSLQTLIEADDIPISLGAQHCHWEEKGALTGEVSTEMLAKLNVSFVIVGHSERRHVFGETNEDVNRKLHAIISKEMTPILCVGETLEQRESGETANVVESQLKAGLDGVALKNVASMVIAYEPVWAIGTGKNATPEDAQEVCNSIRSWITENWKAAGEEVRIQYGGSVKGVNAPDLMKQSDIDGLLVGGASLDPDEFSRIIKYRLVD